MAVSVETVIAAIALLFFTMTVAWFIVDTRWKVQYMREKLERLHPGTDFSDPSSSPPCAIQ